MYWSGWERLNPGPTPESYHEIGITAKSGLGWHYVNSTMKDTNSPLPRFVHMDGGKPEIDHA